MKKFGFLICAVAVVLMASAAFAQQPERPGQGRPGQGRPGQGRPGGGFGFQIAILRALDADGDGTISKKEIEGAVAALKKLDANDDGQLTREEYFGARPAGAGRPGGAGGFDLAARLKELDKNGDGKISKEEAPERMQQGFDRLDTNSDGFLDEAELRRLGGGGRGRGGADGGRPGGRPGGNRPARPAGDN